MNLRDYKTVADRREALEKQTGVVLSNVGHYSLEEAVASTRNCENMIGVAQVPMGIAGPQKVNSLQFSVYSYYVPLATTEGALVASVNRGCKAITESGGAVVDSYRVGATRGVAFHVSGLAENDKLNTFLEEHFQALQEVTAKTSRHLKLTKIFSRGLGRHRYARFIFDTQDAMGMNMATVAATAACQYIEAKTGARCVSVAANYDVDKKPSWLNVIEGRGTKAWAEVTIPARVLKETLKTTARAMHEVWLAKCMIGSAMSGSMGYNAHFANIIAALFAATGQDLGHVSECSIGMTTMEVVNKDLYVSIYLPDLMVGTVGGGTGLATQKEALTLLGVAGDHEGKNAQRFAEIVGATVLAGEISLLASLSEGTLARAHERLGRGKHTLKLKL